MFVIKRVSFITFTKSNSSHIRSTVNKCITYFPVFSFQSSPSMEATANGKQYIKRLTIKKYTYRKLTEHYSKHLRLKQYTNKTCKNYIDWWVSRQRFDSKTFDALIKNFIKISCSPSESHNDNEWGGKKQESLRGVPSEGPRKGANSPCSLQRV